MPNAIFVSAGVPDPLRGPEYAASADVVAITSAVNAIVHVTLGRRQLVWGGHPAITPMIYLVAQSLKVNYSTWVHLYQSRFFKDDFPEDNARFKNVTYIDSVDDDREASLRDMRVTMFRSTEFDAAVFIGGMRGIIDEFELFQNLQPKARIIPIFSTGGATLRLKDRLSEVKEDLSVDLDYIALLYRHLGISEYERRYLTPDSQPAEVAARMRHRQKKAE